VLRDRPRGFTLGELAAALAVAGLILLCAVPAFAALRRRAAVRSAAAELRAVFHLVRSRALARASNSGVKFTRAGPVWQYAIYDDGDGDGVRNDDIKSGVDRRVAPARCLWQQPQIVAIALPPFAIKDPDGDAMAPDDSPVQFNQSAICSFSRLGQATPGTIYMTDSAGEVYAVRVYGATAKMRVLRYERGTGKWVSK
jgi:type II secretory pathway pseudopilin PulG